MRRIPTPADASEKQIASLMAEDGILPLAEEYNRRYLSWEEVYYRTPEPYDAGAVWRVMRHLRSAPHQSSGSGMRDSRSI